MTPQEQKQVDEAIECVDFCLTDNSTTEMLEKPDKNGWIRVTTKDEIRATVLKKRISGLRFALSILTKYRDGEIVRNKIAEVYLSLIPEGPSGDLGDNPYCKDMAELSANKITDIIADLALAEKKDIDGMIVVHGKGSQDVCIGYGWNSALEHIAKLIKK